MSSLLLFEPEFDEMRATFDQALPPIVEEDHRGVDIQRPMVINDSPPVDGASYACPDCAFLARSKAGMSSHRRAKH
eukprot:1311161-Prorocentrum_lima.AAC.1